MSNAFSATPPWDTQRLSPARQPRVLVVDDVRIVRDRVCFLLDTNGYEAVPAESGEQAVALARCAADERRPFALAIVDILMPNARIEGIELARILTHELRVLCLMLTVVQEAGMRVAANLAGALGYLVKDVATGDEAILAAVRAALAGKPVPDPLAGLEIAEADAVAIYQRQKIVDLAIKQLTPRQRRVARMASRGLTNKEIAERLVISVATVNTHMQEILARLGLSSRRDLQPWLLYDSLVERALGGDDSHTS